MRIQTFSVIAGSEACNARCPFCISKMTPKQGVNLKVPEPDWRNFAKACRLAQMAQVTTVLITGKGEPTLFPQMVTAYLERLAPYDFPFIELQTNGIPVADGKVDAATLERWYDLGLSTIILSVTGIDAALNQQVYLPHREAYIDLTALVATLHRLRFSVRLGVVALAEGVCTPAKLTELIAYAKANRIGQLTVRPVTTPDATTVQDRAVYEWSKQHAVPDATWADLIAWANDHAKVLMHLAHGAVVYDLHGQNVCLSTCLTIRPDERDLRQLIYFPDGRLRYDWQYTGAVLL